MSQVPEDKIIQEEDNEHGLAIQQIEEVETKEKFTIFCGTYEGAILGLAGDLSKLELKYAFKPSTNSLKCMDVSGKYLVVGGFDEYLRIYDLKRQRECGILDSHIGTITNIKSHQEIVFSCAEDGLIKVWKMKEFGLLHTLKEHKAAVNDIAVHESGKILVSVSKDKRLIIWNLLNAKKVFSMNLKYNPYKVEITEQNILTLSDQEIHVIDLVTNKEILVLKQDKLVTLNDFQVYKQNFVVVGDSSGYIVIWDIRTSQNISFRAHDTRVKKLQICKIDGIDIIVTVSTNGEIHLFDSLIIFKDIDQISQSKELKDLKPIYKVNTLNRLITLSVFMGISKEKLTAEEEDEEDLKEQIPAKKHKQQQQKLQSLEQLQQNINNHTKQISQKDKKVKVTIQAEGETDKVQQIIVQNKQQKQLQEQQNKKKNKKAQKKLNKLKNQQEQQKQQQNVNKSNKSDNKVTSNNKAHSKNTNQQQQTGKKIPIEVVSQDAVPKQKKIKKAVRFE